MDEAMLQAYGRLTAHEFLLEVLYANWLAHMTQADADRTISELRNRMRRSYSAPDADQSMAENFGLQIVQDAKQLMDRFLKKVEARTSEIREQISRMS